MLKACNALYTHRNTHHPIQALATVCVGNKNKRTQRRHRLYMYLFYVINIFNIVKVTRSHPEIIGDMLPVTLNFDLSKIPFVRF